MIEIVEVEVIPIAAVVKKVKAHLTRLFSSFVIECDEALIAESRLPREIVIGTSGGVLLNMALVAGAAIHGVPSEKRKEVCDRISEMVVAEFKREAA
jgi:hypothetical protein